MYCYQCDDFPCSLLQKLDDSYSSLYRMSMVENQKIMKKEGVKGLLLREEEKWKCPDCGGVISCHNDICFSGYTVFEAEGKQVEVQSLNIRQNRVESRNHPLQFMDIGVGSIHHPSGHLLQILEFLPLGSDPFQHGPFSCQRVFAARLAKTALQNVVGCMKENNLQVGTSLP